MHHFEWDEPHPEEIRAKCYTALQDIQQARKLELQRCYFLPVKPGTPDPHKHVFADASPYASMQRCRPVLGNGKNSQCFYQETHTSTVRAYGCIDRCKTRKLYMPLPLFKVQ